MTLNKLITELPPFTPQLLDFRRQEFHAQSLELLRFPIEHDQAELDRGAFRIDPPVPPPDPTLPLLPHVWYPKPIQAVREWALGRMMPSRPVQFFGKVRNSQANDLMQPLLAGQGGVLVRGAIGMGKTTLLSYIATHEKTTRRYRRIWWIDDPRRAMQYLALGLDAGQVITRPTFTEQIGILHDALDDNTLVIIDNLRPEEVELFRPLTRHLLMGVEMEPEALLEGDEPLTDPVGVVTIRALPRTDAIEFMGQMCGITDPKEQMRGQMKAWLTQMARLLDGNPLAMNITGALFREDGFPMEQLVNLLDERIKPEDPKPELGIDLSLDALPSDYATLLIALSTLPATGASFEAIMAVANLRNTITGHRGLSFLARRGFIRRDERPGEHYIAHPMIWNRMSKVDLHNANNEFGERARRWVLATARRHSESAEDIYRYQDEILHVLDMAQKQHLEDVIHKMNMTLGSYFREYAPEYLAEDTPTPRLMGKRAEIARLSQDALDHLKKNNIEQADITIDQALQLAEKYASDHEYAETLVIGATVADAKQEYRRATKYLENAAKLVIELENAESEHILRVCLAMLYRKQGRYKDALGVLDEEADTFAEKARIYRASQQWEEMMNALAMAGNLSARERAESYILAGYYAEALEALSDRQDSSSALLRAKIYHLQDDLQDAIRGYQQAIEGSASDNPMVLDARLAIGIAYAAQSEFKSAQAEFDTVLDLLNKHENPDAYLKGKALGLMACLNWQDGNPNETLRLGEQALNLLKKENSPRTHRIQADVYRVMARANAHLGRTKPMLIAYEGEVSEAQSAELRDEYRIGVALHHLADAYRAEGELDRAIANYRRVLTHKKANEHPLSYFMTQVALYETLVEAERFPDAVEVGNQALKHLDARPPADLQHLGYMLCSHAATFEKMERYHEAQTLLGRWLSVLAGRSDALRDEERPLLGLLALNLATRSLLASQRADEALPIAETALALAERLRPGTPVAWSSRRDVGEVYLAQGKWQPAIDTLQLLFQESSPIDAETYAFAQTEVAYAYWQLKDLEKALDHYQKALDREPSVHKQGLILEQMATIYLEKRDATGAIRMTQRAADVLDPHLYITDAARIHTKLAQLYAGSNRFSDAVRVYEDALSMLRSMPDVEPVHMANVYLSLAESNEAQGQYPEAAIAYRNALDILENAPTLATDLHRQALAKLAKVKVTLEKPEEAIVLYQQSREETERYGTPLELGAITSALADLYRDTGHFQDALYFYEQALDLQPASTVPRERAATLRGYGRTLAQTEQFEDARRAWSQALTITTDAPPLEIALTQQAIGQAYRAQQMFSEAETAFIEALKYHEKDTDEIAETLRLYGHTLLEAKRPEDAIKPLTKSLDIEEASPQQVNIRIVRTLELLANAQEQSGDISSAITSHHKAMVYMDRVHQPVQIANRLRTLGRLYTVLERWLDAHKALEDALEIEFGYQPRSDARIAQTLEMIALAYRREGHLEKAADAYRRMASYANLTRTASEELKLTLDELEKQRGTLETARASLGVLERTGANFRDLIYIHALIAHTEARLSNVTASNAAIDQLLTVLEQHADELSAVDTRADYRALAHLFEASQAASDGNLGEAGAHFQRAFYDTDNASLRWVIERGLESVRG